MKDGPINTVHRALAKPQVLARNMVMSIDHPHYGPVNLTGNPINISGADDTTFLAPPIRG